MKYLFFLLGLSIILNANNLQNKYSVYTEYLGMKTLDLNKEQLKLAVPKLEKKIKKDKFFQQFMSEQESNKKRNILNKLNSSSEYNNKLFQIICFTKLGILGQNEKLTGHCAGRTLTQMNNDGYELIQVITGLNSSFGMLFTKRIE
jgi:hypothetical protein